MKHIRSRNIKFRIISTFYVLVLLLQPLALVFVQRVDATANVMTYTLVRTNRMTASTATTGTVCAKPTTVGTEASVKVTFPTNYTVSSTTANWAVGTTNTGWPKDPTDGTTTATAWPSIAAPTGAGDFVIAGQNVSFQSGDLTVGTWYCFNWTNSAALTTKVGATNDNTGTVITQAAGPSAIDTGNYATATVANDQIAVTASVNSSFSFSLSSNSAGLGTLTSANPVSASAVNAIVSTNAFKGWDLWAADPLGTPGLSSSTASKTIAYSPTVGSAAAVLSNGVEGYNLGAGTASGTTCTSVTDSTNFASGGVSYKGGGLDGTLRSVAVSTGVADTCSLPLTVSASISATTPAGTDYQGTMTIVAAGQF